jgi:transcriptional regulator with XRE-family HTH domain
MSSFKALIADRGIPSFKALSLKAQVSIGAIKRLEQGHVLTMQMQTVAKIAGALGLSIDDLVRWSSTDRRSSVSEDFPNASKSTDPTAAIQQEYDRLRQQMSQQEAELRDTFQREAIQTLEPWLLQWSAAVHAAQTNTELPAAKILPLLKPIDKLLEQWELRAIGMVGQEVEYDPTLHQEMNSDGNLIPVGDGLRPSFGHRVRIRYVGYWYGEQVLYRAKIVRV